MPRYAAIDIGSNSVRMMVADVSPGGVWEVLAADRQVTRLGESVFRNGSLSPEALTNLCTQLARMAETIDHYDVTALRVVATSAIRDTGNQAEFMERVGKAIGAPVEIISGLEEARLIHLGVTARWPHPAERVLIIDVGGGSAEFIYSDRGERKEALSKPLGAVRLTEVFLPHDPPQAVELQRLEHYIDEKLAPCVARIGRRTFHRAIGTSATAAAIVCAIQRIPRARRDAADKKKVTLQQVRRLYKDIATRELAALRKTPGVGPRRAEIFVPGVAVFLKAMEAFRLPAMHYLAAGVKDGIIADLAARNVGRERSLLDRDQRRVVEQMARKYGVPVPHARQVAALAHRLFELIEPLHRLPAEYGRLLEAAAYLHDTGHFISESAHHRHSAYIVANSGMPGFTARERMLIAALCRFHRKTMPGLRHELYESMPAQDQQALLFLLPLLRLADSLDRSHSQQVGAVDCHLRPNSILLEVHSAAATDLDLWAAERVTDTFRQVYGLPLQLAHGKSIV